MLLDLFLCFAQVGLFSIGGGYAENEILCKARSLMEQGPFAPQLFHVDLSTKEAMEKGMLCGGKMDVLLEWVDQD